MRREPGFTLVELLVASAIGAMLMIGAMSVVVRLNQTGAELKEHAGAIRLDDVADGIEHDLVNSREMISGGGQLQLSTVTGSGTGGPTIGSPSRVIYSVQTLGGEPWLVRTSVDLLDRSSDNGHPELVAAGITGIGARDANLPPLPPEQLTTGSASGSLPPGFPAGQAVPQRVRLSLMTSSGRYDRVLLLR
jgi:prepilin-type N-terminal cleavage/methylation domain-containing protein